MILWFTIEPGFIEGSGRSHQNDPFASVAPSKSCTRIFRGRNPR